MNYLYGDSTASTLKQNFLEFVRDAIDFCVFVLQADARMKEGRAQIRVLSEESEAEIGRLERFISSVTRSVETGEKGAADSPTAACATRLISMIADAQRASIATIRQELSAAIARIEADEAAGRDACVKALGTLLAPHEPPDASTTTRVGLLESGHYDASLVGKAEPALEWTLEVGIPEGHAWSSTMRVERIMPLLEIRAPQMAGWITKEVKIRPQRIERHVVTQLVDKGTRVTVELRTEPTSGVGFDFHVDVERGSVTKSARVGAADDQSVGPFDLQADDVALVVDLVKKLRESAVTLERRPNISAKFDGTDFRALPTFVDFVERLVAMMAPIVREISQRSLTHNELVLRRLLSNDRREEIFVAKATLREKLAVLPAESRALFEPLGLEVVDKGKAAAAPPPSERPAIRSELPPSIPPPPVPKATGKGPPPVSSVKGAGTATAPTATSAATTTAGARTPQPPTAGPASTRGTPLTPLATPSAFRVPPKRPPSTPQIEVVEEVEMSQDALLGSVPDSRSLSKTDGQPRNEALVAALKKILKLSKNGRAGEAYQEYTNLFSSNAFADYRPDDQRQALKLMVLAKSHPADKETVLAAHKAALTRIKTLVDLTTPPEPADHELLGVTQLYLGDDKAARTAFQTALDTERAKNPQSELVATLMRRVSQL